MANDIQDFPLGANFTDLEAGTLEIDWSGYGTSSAINYNDSEATMLAAVEAAVGSGNATVTKGTDKITVEFIGALANTNIPLGTIASCTLKSKADTITITVNQAGQNDIPGVDESQYIFTNGATTGTFDLNGTMVSTPELLSIQSTCNTVFGFGNTDVQQTGTYDFLIHFQGSLAQTDVALIEITNDLTDGTGVQSQLSSNGAGPVSGQQPIFTISLPDSPTEGYLGTDIPGSGVWGYGAFAFDVESALEAGSFPCSVSGTGSPWVVTGDANGELTVNGVEDSMAPLRRLLSITPMTVQEGGAGGATGAGAKRFLLLGVG